MHSNDINLNFAQDIDMIVAISVSVLILEALAMILFAPLRIGVKSHISLKRQTLYADVRLFGKSVVRVNLKIFDGKFVLKINGKPKPLQKDANGSHKIKILKKFAGAEQIRVASYALALIGITDAKNSAMACALLGQFSNFSAYPSLNYDFLEVDIGAKTRLNILQIAKIVKIVTSR